MTKPARLKLEPPAMPLPADLAGHREEIEKALGTAVLAGTWPADQTYAEADQPRAIGQVLVAAVHKELRDATIAYLYREKMRRSGRIRLATASKAGARLEFLAEVDLIIEVNWTAWSTLSPLQRIALVDHELCHFDQNPDTGFYELRHHDVEEFGIIVRRYGLWTEDLRGFGQDVRSAQRELFPAQPAGTTAAGGE